MFSKKKTECRVCGYRFTPERENIYTAEGTPYIVAKAGFLLQAVIMPYDVINQQFVESLQDLTRECEFSLSEKERREREARDRFTFTEPEQCSLNVDPDTGEVVEESEVADNA